MPELTKEQIEAAEQAWNAVDLSAWTRSGIIKAIAPHVQFPLEEPSAEEVFAAADFVWFRDYRDEIARALRRFVARRNAARLPKPVDPRREVILWTMRIYSPASPVDDMDELADHILAALDARKDGE